MNLYRKPISGIRIAVLLFCFILVQYSKILSAQNPIDPEPGFGTGTLNNPVYVTAVQSDGKVIIGGDFTNYKNIPVSRIARLNADGTLDNSFMVGTGADGIVYSIAVQTDGKIIIGGDFVNYNGTPASRILRLNADGTIDNSMNLGSGANGTVYSIVFVANDKILVGGNFTTYKGATVNRLMRIESDGTFDNSFTVGTGANDAIRTISIQPFDGRAIIGGDFTNFNSTALNRIARVNIDGSNDGTFSVGTGVDYGVYASCVQSDGRIIIGGAFYTYNGTLRKSIVRLESTGALDNTFTTGTGTTDMIYHLDLQSDGKILLSGGFSSYNGNISPRMARINTNGTFDASFNIGYGASERILSFAIQSDDKIVIGGWFYSINTISRNYIARLNSNGSLDEGFAPCLGFNFEIHSIVTQPDGKILMGGSFNSYSGAPVRGIVRLNTNGTMDNSFNTGGSGGSSIYAIALQPDGKIIIGGDFASFNGVSVKGIARLNADGTLDNSFNTGTGANNTVYTLLLQQDGGVLIGGNFSTVNGTSINSIAKLNANGGLDNSFNVGTGATYGVYALVQLPNDQIIMAGDFTNYKGTAINRIARLNSDGSIDNTFTIGSGANATIKKVLILPDNKMIIAGGLTSYNGTVYNRMARLNANGTLDNTFYMGTGFGFSVNSLLLQDDGKIIAGGSFSTFNNVTEGRIIRLNVDGSKDLSFDVGTGANNPVNVLAFQSNGAILMGGSFSTYKGIAHNFIARLGGDNVNPYSKIRGSIYEDANDDCIKQNTEKGIPSVVVKAMPGPYYGGTDEDGNYEIEVESGTATYTVTQAFNPLNALYLINQCATEHTVSLSGNGQDLCCYDFADSIQNCGTALLNIEVSKTRLRRCMKGLTIVSYQNLSNIVAAGTEIRIEYPAYLIPQSSSPAWTSKTGSTLIYAIGTVPDNFEGKISIIDSVVCGDQSIRGLTQCVKATISQPYSCIPENPAWDHSSVKITATCVNDSASFVLLNEGSGDMDGSRSFRIYANDTLIFTNTFQLNSGKQLTVRYLSEGNTIRMEADQHPFHPGKSRPRATVEACGGTTPLTVQGLALSTPADDLDEDVSIHCNVIVDSFDPNDKQVSPAGIGFVNQIVPGQQLNYTIRFQNTGTDTAYTVKIIDTLDVALDPTSFLVTGSSHPYELTISGKGKAVLTFSFNNINLPDSTTNLLKSQGFVSFKILVPETTPIGTSIKNKAAIYFDFNSPVITNETEQLVGITVEEDLSKGTKVEIIQEVVTGVQSSQEKLFKLYPNPSSGMLTVETPYYGDQTEIRIISMLGVIQKTVPISKSTVQQISLEGIQPGLYLYELVQKQEKKEAGLLQLR